MQTDFQGCEFWWKVTLKDELFVLGYFPANPHVFVLIHVNLVLPWSDEEEASMKFKVLNKWEVSKWQ